MSENLQVVSYGGGVNSTAMILLMLEQGRTIDHIIFADTGGEWPETYEYIKRFDRWLLSNYGLSITTVRSKEGTLYDVYLAKRWTPSRSFPSHIERFKIRPILAYLQHIRKGKKVEQYIGIDYGERERQHDPRRKFIVANHYPLIDAEIGREGCKRLIREAGLTLPMKSGCYFCPYADRQRWLKLHREHPDLFENACKLEEAGKTYPNYTLFYGGPLRKMDKLMKGQGTLDASCLEVEMCHL